MTTVTRPARRVSYPDGSPGHTAPRPAATPAPAPAPASTPKMKPKAPVPDTCSLHIRIRQEDYRVRLFPPDPAAGLIALVRLTKGDGTHYHVAAIGDGSMTCDCADFEFRHAGNNTFCKHCRSLVAVGLVPKPTPREDLDAFTRQSLTNAIAEGICDGN